MASWHKRFVRRELVRSQEVTTSRKLCLHKHLESGALGSPGKHGS